MGRHNEANGGLGTTFLVLLVLCSFTHGSLAAVCNAADKQALLTFKGQFVDKANVLASWNPATDCCRGWNGVTCDKTGRVGQLILTAGSTGQLQVNPSAKGPGSSLGNLKALTDLQLTNVQFGFRVPVPVQFFSLTNLVTLFLDTTDFIGGIPSQIGSLVKLNDLRLAGNRFSGGLPDSIGNLQNLQRLIVARNGMTIIGSTRLTLLKSIQSIDLSGNQFSGPIPKWLGGLTFAPSTFDADLDISGNAFNGPIPAELFSIKGITRLFLYGNKLSSISPQIKSCPTLRELVMFDNKLAGPIPPAIGNCKNLQRLGAANNLLTGPLPRELGDLPNFTELDLVDNRLTGSFPSNYGPFLDDIESTRFMGANNKLTGPIPKDMQNLRPDAFRPPGNPGLCGAPLPNKCR